MRWGLVNHRTSGGWHSRQLDEEARVRRIGLVTVLVEDVAQPDGGLTSATAPLARVDTRLAGSRGQ